MYSSLESRACIDAIYKFARFFSNIFFFSVWSIQPLKIDFKLFLSCFFFLSIRTLKIHKENNWLAVRGPCLFSLCTSSLLFYFFPYDWLLRFSCLIRLLTVFFSNCVYLSQFDVFFNLSHAYKRCLVLN